MPYESFDAVASKPLDTSRALLLKIGRKDHLELLAQGKLRFRRLGFYKEVEGPLQSYHDPDEGIESVMQGNEIKFVMKLPGGETHELSSETGLIDLRVHSGFEALVLCLHAIHTNDWAQREFTEEQIPELKAHMQIPSSMEKFGDHVWMITNLAKFNERLVEAVKDLGVGVKSRFVRYIDFSLVHGTLSDEWKSFVKHIRFKDEREFRCQILSQRPLIDPLVIDVGSLQDVSKIMSLAEFREAFNNSFYVRRSPEGRGQAT